MRIVCILFILHLSFYATAKDDLLKVKFHVGDFESALLKAGDEGKLLLVSFYADWCTPCLWMEQTAFTDQEVIGIMSENYIAFRVDIDEPEGYTKKNQYAISILPTIMIFNASGQLIERIEETLSPRNLERLLATHNKEDNKAPLKHPINRSPVKNSSELVRTESEPRINSYTPIRIQMGVFGEVRNTETMVNHLKSLFSEPIIVLNDSKDGKIMYKVMLGAFKSTEEALMFKNVLERDHQMEGIIK